MTFRFKSQGVRVSGATLILSVVATVAAVTAPAVASAQSVVLGKWAGTGSVGYGTERPQVISLGSCANAINHITWNDWGGAVAHGSGTGCSQVGDSPQYSLVASDIGTCDGVGLAYRTLVIGTNDPRSIC